MTKNIFKKFITLFSLLVLFTGFNPVFAEGDSGIGLETPASSFQTAAEPVTLSSIFIKTPATKTSYMIGDSLDIDGLIISGVYSDGSEKEETITETNISGFDSSKVLSAQILTVNLSDKKITYTIDIVPKTVDIYLSIISNEKTLYSGNFSVDSCDSDNDESTIDTVSGYCAILESGFVNEWSWSGNDVFLNKIGDYENNKDDNGVYWGWFSNLELGGTGLNKYILNEGDNLLLNYNINPLKISVDNTNPTVGDTITFSVKEFKYDDSWAPVWVNATDGILSIGENNFSLDSNGQYKIRILGETPFSVVAKKDGRIDSGSISINPIELKTNIVIRNGDNIIYEGKYELPKEEVVSILDKNGIGHSVNSRSVLAILSGIESENFSISNLEYNESWGSLYMKCLITKDLNELCDNWQYVVAGSYPFVGMDKNILTFNEKIYLFYGTQNRVLLSKNSINSNETLSVTAEKYNYENNSWSSRTGVTVGVTKPDPANPWSPDDSINYLVDANGVATFSSIPVGEYGVGIKEDFYWPIENLVVTLYVPGSSSGSGENTGVNTFLVSKALEFLNKNQNEDGSFGNSMYTDWAAIAAVAGGNSILKSSLSNYLKSNSIDSSVLTDYERRAMALMALGINPYNGTDINYINKIIESFDGTQFGDDSLINDDIFALIVLKNAGYTESDEMIEKDISYIISKQSSNGSWGSIDMTAAGIQSLHGFDDASSSISKAENFLKTNQKTDGGFENSFSTAWVLQSMFSDSQILKAENYLSLKQQSDGGMENTTDDIDTRVWATSYVIPAVLHKTWDDILRNFSKPEIEENKTENDSEILKENLVQPVKTPEVLVDSPMIIEGDSLKVLGENVKFKSDSLPAIQEENSGDLESIQKENIIFDQEKNNNSNTFSSYFVGIWAAIKSSFAWLLIKLGF